METPVAPCAQLPLSPAAYVRSRHAVWMGSAALITDELGRILLVRDIGGRWLLPGGGVEAGESPWAGCRREGCEETGLQLDPNAAELLAVYWIAVEDREPFRALGFPGEVIAIFDGGTLTPQRAADLRCADGEIAEHTFVDSARAAELLTPVSGRVALAALRARLGGTGTVYLESGHHPGTPPVLDKYEVHVRPGRYGTLPWHPDTPHPKGCRWCRRGGGCSPVSR